MPQTILVVDDELDETRGLRVDHVRHVAVGFYEAVADTTSPVFASLWEIAQAIPPVLPKVDDETKAASYFATDAAVQEVLLHPSLARLASPELTRLLTPFLGRAARANVLKGQFKEAFPAPDFVLRFVGAPRPKLADVISSSAVFLDLFLEDNVADPVDAMQGYLKGLADQAPATVLPPIILMSMHTELSEHRRSFSERSQISAAGLSVLRKERIARPDFGSVGLRLNFDQLREQSATAHAIRLFIRSWMSALKSAAEGTATTLWNLDAPAMQQIHFASFSDGDAYEEHLSELLSREHLFRVEADSAVVGRIAELDSQFRQHLTNDGEAIANRYIAPVTEVETSRALMSHFTWFGARPSQPLIAENDEASAAAAGRSMPFGTVVCGPDFAHPLVHITQQCDINRIARKRDAGETLLFAVTEARELLPSDNPNYGTKDFYARNLQVDDNGVCREFDLKTFPGKLLAMPLRDFMRYARDHELRVIGRLRSDITNQIVAATTNHMSRPASQKMLRAGLVRSKVFLQHARLEGGPLGLQESPGVEKVFSLTLSEGQYSFQDDACVEIALWLVHHLAGCGIAADAKALCTKLRCGWKSEKPLVHGTSARVRNSLAFDRAVDSLVAGDVVGQKAQMTVLLDVAVIAPPAA